MWPFLTQIAVEIVLIAPTLIDMAYLGGDYALRPVVRSTQLCRVLHVPYWYKITGMAERVRDWLRHRSREFRAGWNLMWILLLGLLFIHLLTCSWFWVGLYDGGWLADSDVLSEEDLVNRYIRSLEWAVSRLPPSHLPSNMQLRTRLERFLALTATALVVVFGAIFTSIITNDMSDIRRVRRQQKEHEYQVLDFFGSFSVSGELQRKVKRYLQQSVAKIHQPGKEEMRSILPEYLFGEICREAYAPIMRKHPVFQAVTNRHPGFTYDLTMRCLQDWYVVPDEILFSAGPKCDHMLFVAHGSVNYWMMTSEEASEAEKVPRLVRQFSVRPFGSTCLKKLSVGDWMCEMCLWTAWVYRGRAVAGVGTTLLCLSAEKLMDSISDHKEIIAELCFYGNGVITELNQMHEEELTDILRFEI